MAGFLIVFCSCGSEEEERMLAQAAVEKRLAACANVLPPMTSVYRWKGKVETAYEYLLLAKTTEDRFPALRQALKEMHSYEKPEIVAVGIANGSADYLAWISENV